MTAEGIEVAEHGLLDRGPRLVVIDLDRHAPPARVQSPASSTRAASNVCADAAMRSIRPNVDQTSVTSRNRTSSGSSAPTSKVNACSAIRAVANVTRIRSSTTPVATRQP
jgi:hypothetical protein